MLFYLNLMNERMNERKNRTFISKPTKCQITDRCDVFMLALVSALCLQQFLS